MADEDENDLEKEYPGGRVGQNARIIKDKEKDIVIIEEINHGFINDGYDKYLYEDEGNDYITFILYAKITRLRQSCDSFYVHK